MVRFIGISTYLAPFLRRTPYQYKPADEVKNNVMVKLSAKSSDKKGHSLQIRRYKTK